MENKEESKKSASPPSKKTVESKEEHHHSKAGKPAKKKLKHDLLQQGKLLLYGVNEEDSKNNKTLIIIGTPESGKSSIFSLLTSGYASDSISSSNGVSYGFMRHKNKDSKRILNIYEIGGGINNLRLIKSVVRQTNIENLCFVLNLDLSRPVKLLENYLEFNMEIRNILKEIYDKETLENNVRNKVSKYKIKKLPDDFSVSPVDFYLICNKYDLFEKIDIDKIKWTARTLRYFSYTNGINLIFYSHKKSDLVSKLKAAFTYYAFKLSLIDNIDTYVEKNDIKPLFLKYYNDSLEEIGEPKVMQSSGLENKSRWMQTFQTIFKDFSDSDIPSSSESNIKLDASFFGKYTEPRIDSEYKLFEAAKERHEEEGKKFVGVSKEAGPGSPGTKVPVRTRTDK